MPNKTQIKEYFEKYGDIKNNLFDRFKNILQTEKFKDKDIEKLNKNIKKLKNNKFIDLNFIFYFIPKATPRARYSGRTKVFYVNDAKNNSDLFEKFMKENLAEYNLITTPCKFYCSTYKPMPSQMNKQEKALSELKLIPDVFNPDWDNLGKTYSDMIQKHLLLNDCLIYHGAVTKLYSTKPRVEIRIEYMAEYDCNFNKKGIEKWKYYKENIGRIEEKNSIL